MATAPKTNTAAAKSAPQPTKEELEAQAAAAAAAQEAQARADAEAAAAAAAAAAAEAAANQDAAGSTDAESTGTPSPDPENTVQTDVVTNFETQHADNAALIAGKTPAEPVGEDKILVNVPKAFTLTDDLHRPFHYKAGPQRMPATHFAHSYTKAHGVTEIE